MLIPVAQFCGTAVIHVSADCMLPVGQCSMGRGRAGKLASGVSAAQ